MPRNSQKYDKFWLFPLFPSRPTRNEAKIQWIMVKKRNILQFYCKYAYAIPKIDKFMWYIILPKSLKMSKDFDWLCPNSLIYLKIRIIDYITLSFIE